MPLEQPAHREEGEMNVAEQDAEREKLDSHSQSGPEKSEDYVEGRSNPSQEDGSHS
jgi:hypothetical protein